jgi:predicted transcriptional regulator
MVYLKVYYMPTIATKLSPELANRVQRAAKSRKTTISALVRKAVESEVSGGQAETFGSRFGHLFGAAKGLPSNSSRKEAYED